MSCSAMNGMTPLWNKYPSDYMVTYLAISGDRKTEPFGITLTGFGDKLSRYFRSSGSREIS